MPLMTVGHSECALRRSICESSTVVRRMTLALKEGGFPTGQDSENFALAEK